MANGKLKIMLSVPSFFPDSFGGGQIYVYQIAKELLQRGHDVSVSTYVQWNDAKEPYIIKRYTHKNIPIVAFSLNPKNMSAVEKHIRYGPLISQIIRKSYKKLPQTLFT